MIVKAADVRRLIQGVCSSIFFSFRSGESDLRIGLCFYVEKKLIYVLVHIFHFESFYSINSFTIIKNTMTKQNKIKIAQKYNSIQLLFSYVFVDFFLLDL